MSVHRLALVVLLMAACHHGSTDDGTDAAASGGDAAVDLSQDGMLGDAGADAGPRDDGAVVCGSTRCHAGSTCVAGACEDTTCAGVKVPGDYATVQAAVNALTNGGGSGTICMGSFTEPSSVDVQQGSIVLHGLSPDLSTLPGLTAGSASLTVAGVTVKALYCDRCTALTVSESVVEAATITAQEGASAPTPIPQVLFDGVDFASPSAAATLLGVRRAATLPAQIVLAVRNCYFHDANVALSVDADLAGPVGSTYTLTLANNTFVHNTTAIDFALGSNAIYNNLFVGNGLAVRSDEVAIVDADNVYFGNTTNFAGLATADSGDLFVDPLLDGATPPGLLAGSPARGAAAAAYAPNLDYWGRVRGASPDIGAVQSSP